MDKRYTVGVDMGVDRDRSAVTIVKREPRKKSWKPRTFPPDWLHTFCERLPRPFGLWIMTVWYRVPHIWKHGWGQPEPDRRWWKPLTLSDADLGFLNIADWQDRLFKAFRIPADMLVADAHQEMVRQRESAFGTARVHGAMLTMRQEKVIADLWRKMRKAYGRKD